MDAPCFGEYEADSKAAAQKGSGQDPHAPTCDGEPSLCGLPLPTSVRPAGHVTEY